MRMLIDCCVLNRNVVDMTKLRVDTRMFLNIPIMELKTAFDDNKLVFHVTTHSRHTSKIILNAAES